MQPLSNQKPHSPAWLVQIWVSFLLAISVTSAGIFYLPVDNWVKGFMGMGLAFSVGSSFSLSKTIRDEYEAKKLASRIEEARVEKLLVDHHPLK